MIYIENTYISYKHVIIPDMSGSHRTTDKDILFKIILCLCE